MFFRLRWLLAAFVGLVLLFLVAPLAAVVLSSFSASGVMNFPPTGFTTHWYRVIDASYWGAARNSLVVAACTTAIATLAGTPAALVLARGRFPGRAALAAFCLSPLMVATLVIGVAAFQFSFLLWDWFGLNLSGSIPGLVLAHSAFTIPFVIRAVVAAQAHHDHALEEAARSLGAGPAETFLRVTLPLLLPGVVSGGIFAFVMSFDDIAIALFLGGGDAMTLPVKIYTSVEFNFNPDLMAVSSLVTGASLLLMLLLDKLTGLERVAGGARG
ncbi:MAG: ABC transporter permease [Xenophilus sp.]